MIDVIVPKDHEEHTLEVIIDNDTPRQMYLGITIISSKQQMITLLENISKIGNKLASEW